MALALLVIGALFSDADGVLGVVGLVVLAQAIGLAVAVVWFGAAQNPLSRK